MSQGVEFTVSRNGPDLYLEAGVEHVYYIRAQQ